MNQYTFSEITRNEGIFIDGDWIESKDQDPKGSVRLIQLADIGDGVFINKSKRFLTNEKAKELKCTYLKAGDVLIARMPDPLGRACIFPELNYPCVTVVDVCIVRPDKKIIAPEWLTYLINSPLFRNKIDKYITGTTRQRISRGNLEKIKFNTPSLKEQKQIVKILDQADALRQKRKEAIVLLDKYIKSFFLEMFGDPVLNSKNWPIIKFKNVGTLERGKSKHRPRNAPELLGGAYPLIQTGDVANSDGYIQQFTQTYSELGLKQSRMWPVGTLCITIAANIAKTGILTFESCFPDSIVGFTPNTKVRTEYVQFWLNFLQKTLEDKAPESAQKNINLEILRNLDLPVPPIDLQNKFADLVLKTEKIKQKMIDQSIELENQFHALMQRYFTTH